MMTDTTTTTPADQDAIELAQRYQHALAQDPENPGLLFQLGRAMGRLGQRDLELALVGQAVARAPAVPEYHVALGGSLLACGYSDEARESFEAALAVGPTHDDARARLADLELDRGHVARARQLLDPPPVSEAADRPLGRLALAEGQLDDATRRLMAHLTRVPVDAVGLFYLGVALQGREMFEPAAACYQQALAIDPSLFEAHANLSTVLLALGRPAESLVHAGKAAVLEPSRPGVYLNRSNARRDLGDLAGAIADLRHAVELAPAYPEAWSSLGNLYHDAGELGLALAAHQRAVEVGPELAQAHWNRSFALLASGQLEPGWQEYEYRLVTTAARPEPRDFAWPVLNGPAQPGSRVLVYREQGLGDELMFLTCLADLHASGVRVTALVSPRLVPMVRRAYPDIDVRADSGGAVDRDDRFDAQTPLGSLPRWYRSARAAFPSRPVPWPADPRRVAEWRRRLDRLGPGPKLGWCWRSGLRSAERSRHYAPIEAYRPLLTMAGCRWINLQYDDCEAELAEVEARDGVRVHRWADVDLRNDLDGVMALISCLEAVVTAPTAVSSLAGLVGCPTWQLDAGGDWTSFGEDRSPWFPSIRVVRRQPEPAGWAPAVEQIRAALAG